MRRTAELGALTGLCILVTGCRSEPPVLFIVPDRYSGPIVVMDDPAAPPLKLVNGKYEIVVPPQGFVKVRNILKTIGTSMNESARYVSGAPIPRATDYNQLPSQIAFRGGGGYGQAGGPEGTIPNHLTYFVGTQAKQYATLWKSDYRYLVKIRDAKAGQSVQIWP